MSQRRNVWMASLVLVPFTIFAIFINPVTANEVPDHPLFVSWKTLPAVQAQPRLMRGPISVSQQNKSQVSPAPENSTSTISSEADEFVDAIIPPAKSTDKEKVDYAKAMEFLSIGGVAEKSGTNAAAKISEADSLKDHRAAIFEVKGEVRILKKGTDHWQPAVKDMAIEEGDQIVTGKNSTVDVVYDSKFLNVARIEQKTKAEFRSIEPTNVFMEDGTIFSALDGLNGGKYQVSTPTAVAGVRGTHLDVQAAAGQFNYVAVVQDQKPHISHVEVQLNDGRNYDVVEGKQISFAEGSKAEIQKVDAAITERTGQFVQIVPQIAQTLPQDFTGVKEITTHVMTDFGMKPQEAEKLAAVMEKAVENGERLEHIAPQAILASPTGDMKFLGDTKQFEKAYEKALEESNEKGRSPNSFEAPEVKNLETFKERPVPIPDASTLRIENAKVETRQAEATKAELPKVETPKIETPKVEAPKVEVETPKVETPKVETPKVETPKVEVEAPKVEVPKVEVETPKVETPKVETPKVETPKDEGKGKDKG